MVSLLEVVIDLYIVGAVGCFPRKLITSLCRTLPSVETGYDVT